MFCPFCGTDNAADQRYCRNCGASLPTNTAKPATKPHSAVGSGGSSRASGPFVPPQPPNLPGRKGKNINPDPYATSVSSALSEDGLGSPSTSTADFARPDGGENDNFFETQVSYPLNTGKKKGPSADMQTIEMGSLHSSVPTGGEEEDMRSTSLAMSVVKVPPTSSHQAPAFAVGDEEEDMRSTSLAVSVVKLPGAPPPPPPPKLPPNLQKSIPIPSTLVSTPPPATASTMEGDLPSEEYFPTLLASKAPPSSREEQLKLLNEIMESESNNEPLSGDGDQTLAMGTAKPKASQSPSVRTDDFPGLGAASADQSSSFDQTIRAGSMSKVDSFNQTLANGSSQQGVTGKKKEDAFPGGIIPETLTMRAVNRAEKEESFSYPNLEDNLSAQDNSYEDLSSDTIMITPPHGAKKPADIPDAISADATSPWGTPPKPADFPSLSKTEALSIDYTTDGMPDLPLSEEDPFKTTAVPFIPTKVKKNVESDTDPLRTTVSNPAYKPDAVTEIATPAIIVPTPDLPMVTTPPTLVSTAPPMAPTTTPPKKGEKGDKSAKGAKENKGTKEAKADVAPSVPELVGNDASAVATAGGSSSKIIPIVIILVVTLLGAAIVGGYGVWKYFFKVTPVKIVTPSPVPTVVASAKPTATPTPTPTPTSIATGPANMVLIDGGEYVIGCDKGLAGCEGKDTASSPAHTVSVDAFYLDIYEVTNEDYAKFIKATNHRKPPDWKADGTAPGDAKAPVVNVNWEDAKAYAEWAGKRLPTEEEWEVAAGGKTHTTYPWGNDADVKRSNNSEAKAGNLVPVGSIAEGKSATGVYDMSGNVWEWTSSVAEPYPNADDFLSLDKPEQNRVIRGGSYKDKLKYCTTVYRGFVLTTTTNPVLGFRCAKDAPQPSK